MNTAKKILGILETSVKLDEGIWGPTVDDKLTLTDLFSKSDGNSIELWIDRAAFRSYKEENIPFSRSFHLDTRTVTPKSVALTYCAGDQTSDSFGYDLAFVYHKGEDLKIELIITDDHKTFGRESANYIISRNQTDVYSAIRKAIKSLYYDSKIVAARKSFIQ